MQPHLTDLPSLVIFLTHKHPSFSSFNTHTGSQHQLQPIRLCTAASTQFCIITFWHTHIIQFFHCCQAVFSAHHFIITSVASQSHHSISWQPFSHPSFPLLGIISWHTSSGNSPSWQQVKHFKL